MGGSDFKRDLKGASEGFRRELDEAGPLQRCRLLLRAHWIGVNLRYPVLMPCFAGGIIALVVAEIVNFVIPDERGMAFWIGLGAAALMALPWMWRNMDFTDWVAERLENGDLERSENHSDHEED